MLREKDKQLQESKQNHCHSLETSQEMSFRKGSDLRVLARSVHEIKTKKNGGEWK